VSAPITAPAGKPAAKGGGALGWIAFFGALGLLFAYFSWSQFSEHRALASNGVRVQAVVVGYETVRGRRTTSYYPMFRFATTDGRRVEATSGASATPSDLPRGSTIAVVYDRADPGRVRQQAAVEGGPGFTPWFLGFLALLMFALAAVFVLPQRPQQPPG